MRNAIVISAAVAAILSLATPASAFSLTCWSAARPHMQTKCGVGDGPAASLSPQSFSGTQVEVVIVAPETGGEETHGCENLPTWVGGDPTE